MHHRSGRLFLASGAVFLCLFGLFAGGALAQSKTIEEIIAWVNNDVILKSEYDARSAQLRQSLAAPAPQGLGLQGAQLEQRFNQESKFVLRNMIDEALLMQQAKDMGLTGDIELTKALDKIRQDQKLDSIEALEKEIVAQGYNVDDFKQSIRVQLLSEQVLQREVAQRVTITTEEARKYYESHIKDFDRPAGIRVREITVLTQDRSPEGVQEQRKKIDEALAAIKQGQDFAEVAGKYSESSTASIGGDLGFYAKGELDPRLSAVTDKLEKGQVSDVIEVPGAFMILKVDDKHNGGILPFELAQKEVLDKLWQQAMPVKEREYLTKLRHDGFVRVAEGYVDAGASAETEKTAAKQ